ncbi:hypothetical protein HPB51_029597 [Rhipicephalus microplus]|uniref:Sushi domain-containing protein n=1 Tax=Rhipicephalus microplus TaxID=6941 RepID=A0A9J6CUD5_RHIMP|nr:hypothetical protein HPB51_029597 [Rhipicephalus microplus]
MTKPAAVHCRPLPSVSGLSVSTATTRMGTKVVFSCDEGQRLRGSQQAMCLPSGNWSAPPPICQAPAKSQDFICYTAVAECHDITGASDGLVVVKAEQRAVGSRAHFSCPLGYALRGQASVECLDTGQWSDHCRAVKVCTSVVKTLSQSGNHEAAACSHDREIETSGSSIKDLSRFRYLPEEDRFR